MSIQEKKKQAYIAQWVNIQKHVCDFLRKVYNLTKGYLHVIGLEFWKLSVAVIKGEKWKKKAYFEKKKVLISICEATEQGKPRNFNLLDIIKTKLCNLLLYYSVRWNGTIK